MAAFVILKKGAVGAVKPIIHVNLDTRKWVITKQAFKQRPERGGETVYVVQYGDIKDYIRSGPLTVLMRESTLNRILKGDFVISTDKEGFLVLKEKATGLVTCAYTSFIN